MNQEKIGDLSVQEAEQLVTERDYWEVRIEELERIAEQQGMEAVLPTLRR
jgi:hypothetical protein